jgi:hypothetical protein
VGKRILVLGTTGVSKRGTIANLIKYRQETADAEYQACIVDFEKDYVGPNTPLGRLHEYLDSKPLYQHQQWRTCMEKFMRDHSSPTQDTFLLLHGTIMRDKYGSRSPVSLPPLVQWRPDLVVTLIEDVQVCWQRTQEFAAGERYRGMPTLEQLIANRRMEIFLGDVLAANVGDLNHDGRMIAHYVVAVRHPCCVLDRLVHPANDTRRVYLSFPIGAPRRMLQRGDTGGVAAVNAFLKQAYTFAESRRRLVLFCPLCIDELPLVKQQGDATEQTVTFKGSSRWDVTTFLNTASLAEGAYPHEIRVPCDEVAAASAGMEYDVRTRDYRLIDQATAVAVFNPVLREDPAAPDDQSGHLSGGVANEIEYAMQSNVPIHIYQDPQHDPQGTFRSSMMSEASALGQRPGRDLVTFHATTEELLEALLR